MRKIPSHCEIWCLFIAFWGYSSLSGC